MPLIKGKSRESVIRFALGAWFAVDILSATSRDNLGGQTATGDLAPAKGKAAAK